MFNCWAVPLVSSVFLDQHAHFFLGFLDSLYGFSRSSIRCFQGSLLNFGVICLADWRPVFGSRSGGFPFSAPLPEDAQDDYDGECFDGTESPLELVFQVVLARLDVLRIPSL